MFFVWDELFSSWISGDLSTAIPNVEPVSHWETPAGKRRIYSLIETSGIGSHLTKIAPVAATKDQVKLVHSEAYVESLDEANKSSAGVDLGEEVFLGSGKLHIAYKSAGGAIAVVDAICQVDENDGNDPTCRRAYALIRPPGHHAERDRAMGFCVFNNIAIAAEHAMKEYTFVNKVAIVDFDVHHGNGTQQHFYDRNDVLFISLHQDGNYPANSGSIEENGSGDGEGFNINIPLPPGTGDAGYRAAFEQVVMPAISEFQPDLILVSSGFDASYLDPLGRMMLSSESFRWFTKQLNHLADKFSNGRLAYFHEGGYSEVYVPFCGLAVVEELCGVKSEVTDPFLPEVVKWPGYGELLEHQKKQLDAVRKSVNFSKLKAGDK